MVAYNGAWDAPEKILLSNIIDIATSNLEDASCTIVEQDTLDFTQRYNCDGQSILRNRFHKLNMDNVLLVPSGVSTMSTPNDLIKKIKAELLAKNLNVGFNVKNDLRGPDIARLRSEMIEEA